MFYPNPFDFDRSGDLGFSEQAFQNEFLSDGLDAAEENDDNDNYASGDSDDAFDNGWGDD